jgi:arabinose-5-phosphate isomerase
MLEKSKNLHKENFISIDYQNKIKEDLILVLKKESDAILHLTKNFPQEAIILVDKILKCSGRVIFAGMGKSGHVARKLVATFSSLGISSLFLHPSEALHGDLGMVHKNDLFIALSKSGTGSEFEQIIPLLSSQGNGVTLICCDAGNLCNQVDLVVQLPFRKEACLLNLAPTSSSTLMLSFGDALAVVVSNLRGFTKNDFAKFHPAGSLGKNLLLKVNSFMHAQKDLPIVSADSLFEDVLFIMTSKKLGIAIVVNDSKKLIGVITDGDLRRACGGGEEVFKKMACDIMSLNPKTISDEILAYDALVTMEDSNITSLVVSKDDSVIGLVHIHDLIKAGIRR